MEQVRPGATFVLRFLLHLGLAPPILHLRSLLFAIVPLIRGLLLPERRGILSLLTFLALTFFCFNLYALSLSLALALRLPVARRSRLSLP